MLSATHPPFELFTPPYDRLHPLEAMGDLVGDPRLHSGVAVLWHLGRGKPTRDIQPVLQRPGGIALMVVLPPASRLRQNPDLFRVVESCHPHSIMPFHEEPDPEEVAALLRRPPADFPGQLTDYLAWRGLQVDLDTRRLVRRTAELSEEITTISALARGVYMSRRALGRRFLKAGLPVPSHLLHFCRTLRAAVRLQSTGESVSAAAGALGYPDGFSLSNQMHRLTGVRPSEARNHLGWEWLVEAWLRTEARRGSLRLPLRAGIASETPADGAQRQAQHTRSTPRSRSTRPGRPEGFR